MKEDKFYDFKLAEYNVAWINIMHCNRIYRYTLFAALAYSMAAVAITYDDNIPWGISVTGCIVGIFFSSLTFFTLHKIREVYNSSFELLRDTQRKINKYDPTANKDLQLVLANKPLRNNTFKVKWIGPYILIFNILFLLVAIGQKFEELLRMNGVYN